MHHLKLECFIWCFFFIYFTFKDKKKPKKPDYDIIGIVLRVYEKFKHLKQLFVVKQTFRKIVSQLFGF